MVLPNVPALRNGKLLCRFTVCNLREIQVVHIAELRERSHHHARNCSHRTLLHGSTEGLTRAIFAGVWSAGPALRRTARSLTDPVNGMRMILYGVGNARHGHSLCRSGIAPAVGTHS